MMKRKLLFLTLILQIICTDFAMAATSSGANTEFIPATKNLGIGIINPTTKLDVNGQIMIRGGSPGVGKILSSDANGKASWTTPSSSDASTLDSLDSLQFLRSDTSDNFSSGILIIDSGTRFDVNGDLSIADTDISLDGANTSFTQATGNLALVPASGKDFTSTITSGGEFKINTNDLVFNGTSSRIGIGVSNPSAKLEVNGTIKGSTINGSSANFTNLSTTSITNTGSTNFSKLLVTNNVNGATGNFTTGNLSNAIISGIVNGTTSSFDGDFTNGSVFFSNANGVISQDNSHFFWDNSNKRLALNHRQPDMALDVNGALVLRNFGVFSAGAAPAYNTFNSVSQNNSSPFSLSRPSGTANNDVLILFIADNRGTNIPTPSGWTLITQVSDSVNLRIAGGGAPHAPPLDTIKAAAFYIVSDGSTPDVSYNCIEEHCHAIMLRYSGVDITDIIDAVATNTGSALDPVAPSINTSSANTAIIRFSVTQDEGLATSFNAYPASHTGIHYQDTSIGVIYTATAVTTQASAGSTGTATFTYNRSPGNARFATITLALKSVSSAVDPNAPDANSSILWLANSSTSSSNPGDLMNKTTVGVSTKTIRIIDFNNGQLSSASSANTLDGIDSTSFLRSDASDNYSSGTLTLNSSTSLIMDASSSLDINSTNLSIADTNISLDGTNTSFTQSTGNISFAPAATHDLTTSIATGGEFKINTNDFVFNGTTTNLGIGTSTPATKLDVNGTIKGSTINGVTAANFTRTNLSNLISSGVVNGTNANFTNGYFSGTANTGKLISSGIVNGVTANFSNINASSLNFTNATITTLTSTDINNAGTASTAKLISSGPVNGTTANMNKVISSGSITGADANFTNAIVSGIFNGSSSSFDGDFSNGSILFSNNNGVISQNNSQLYWDRNNNRLALSLSTPNEILTINGALSFKASSTPSATSDFGKLYVSSANSRLYFQDDSGISYSINNGALVSSATPGGSNTHFQFNDGGAFGGNGALTFTKASKTLQVASDTVLDINSTSLSVADNNISFDSASGVTFTPSAGQNLNIALASTGDFTVNTNQLYVGTSSSKVGLNTNNPNETLTINGALSLKEGTAPSATTDFGKLYVKSSDSKLYFKNDSGVEYNLSSPALNSQIDDLLDATSATNHTYLYIGNGSYAVSNYNVTTVGINALHTLNTKTSNTVFGSSALYSTSNGGYNSALGSSALYYNINGSENTAIGSQSLFENLSGSQNTAIGTYSLAGNKRGVENTALGYQTLLSNANGDYNIALGNYALNLNNSGNGNVAIGERTLYGNARTHYNTLAGYNSVYYATDGAYNTSEGYKSLFALRHGDNNVALGSLAISSMSNGSYNIAVGANAGARVGSYPANLFANNGIYLGYNAGYSDKGDNNISIGYNTGNGTITGSSNILIGYNNNNPPSVSSSNQLDIADTIYGDLANHNIGIGTSSIDTKLEVNGSTMVNAIVNKAFYTNSSGSNVTINWNNGNKQQIVLGHNVTFSFTAPTYGIGMFSLLLQQDVTGSRTVTWPASVKWPGGVAPTLSTSPTEIDMITCLYDGNDYLCQIGLKFS